MKEFTEDFLFFCVLFSGFLLAIVAIHHFCK